MDAMRICSVCSKPVAANAPQGLCPECLLKAALGTGVDIGPDSQSQAENGQAPFVAPTPEELAKLFPQLEILGFIGQGGMGAVYRARQKALDRIVAIKILPPGIGKDPAFAERFTREAKALARLNHPGIVTLYEFGQADGLFFFLMEFVDGVNLRHLLEAGRLSPREALAIVPQICDALQYAHDQGIVHRDIKPENILLDRQGRVKVADFGLAKLVGTEGEPFADGGVAAGSVVLTEAGKVMGTPPYMAPEQREHPAEVDHRVDIYSLGVVLYQMLTGELPGKRIEPPSHRVQVDVRIDEIVLRALEKTPERRYQTAGDFRTQIETLVHDTGTARLANHTSNSAPRLLNVGTSLVTTPEQLGTFEGQFFLYRRKSQMLLEDRQLTFARGGTTTVIPLAAIRDLSIGHYPRTMHPAGLDFISVTYDEGGQTKRLFFSPYESRFGLPSHFNQFVAEWFAAIRVAVVTATGREPGNTPAEQLGVPSGSKVIYALLLAPVVLASAFLLAGVVMRQCAGDAATHSFLGGLVIFIFAMLVFEVGPIIFLAVRAGKKPAAVGVPLHSKRTNAWGEVLLSVLLQAVVALPLMFFVLYELPTKLQQLFSDLGGSLPPLTLLTVRCGQFLSEWGGVLMLALLGVSFLIGLLAQRVSRRLLWVWAVLPALVLAAVTVMAYLSVVWPLSSTMQRTMQAAKQAKMAVAASPNRVAEVRCEGLKAYIRAELDDLHELRLFIGSDALGWSARQTGSTSVTATLEASDQIKLADGSKGHGLIFQAWSVRHYIAITPDGLVPFGEVVFRENTNVTENDGTFTFADIRQTDGTLVPISVRVRLATSNARESPASARK